MESLASIHDLALLHVFFYKWNHKLFNNSISKAWSNFPFEHHGLD